MPRLIWSPAALRDVQRLYDFLAKNNPAAAKKAVRAIRDSINTLAAQPAVGRPVDHLEPDFREWLIAFGDSGYVLIYRTGPFETILLAIRHQREAGYL
jgi:plasmid stabilization system protein ParE